MAQVITFEDYRPAPRYDATAWTEAELYEGTAVDGPWTLIDTFALSPVDADPENPAYRDFTTELASDEMDLWYYILFKDATGDESQPTAPVQNTTTEAFTSYGSVSELFRILKIRTPSAEQTTAAERVLLAAAGEVNAEIDLAETDSLAGWEHALATEVCLERAVEHWRQQEAPFGLLPIGGELGGGAERTARDTWARHAHKLSPLKRQWGFA
jgi:hypothetical protein